MIKIIFCDISGTLLTTSGDISNETINNIQLLLQKGVNFVLCSGGARGKALYLASNIGIESYIISSNGADIYDMKSKKNLFKNIINLDEIIKIYQIAADNNLYFSMNSNSVIYVNEKRLDVSYELVNNNWDINFFNNHESVQCTISGIPNNQKIIDKILNNIISNQNLKIAINNFGTTENRFANLNLYCDIVKKNTDKQNAAMNLMKKLNILPDQAMAICDGINDIQLFNLVKYKIAMGNAIDELKKRATYVTNTNDENGVNTVLKKVLERNM